MNIRVPRVGKEDFIMNDLVMRSVDGVDFYALYLNGACFYGFRPGEDPAFFDKKVGFCGGF